MNTTLSHPHWPRRAARLSLFCLAAMVGLALGATPASADEFTIAILVDPGVEAGAGATFMEGFQIAVDQSPDVSHPEGVEGGDHLGSMDVVMLVVEGALDPDEFVQAAIELIESDGVAFVVADVSPEATAALFGPVTDAEVMLLTMSDTGGTEFAPTLFFFPAAEHPGAEALLVDRTPTFSDAYTTRYGQPPSAAANRGYMAGRLVDISVEATDRDPTDEVTIAAALLTATGASPEPVSTTTSAPSSSTSSSTTDAATIEAQPIDTETPSGFPAIPLAIGAAVAVIAGFAIRAARRRSRSGF